MLRHTMTTLAALLLLAGVGQAETVYLRGGGTLEGKVLELGPEKLAMTLDGIEGARVEIPLSRVADYGLYELKRARIDPSSPADHEALGDWARDRDLFAFAMEEYAASAKLVGEDAPAALAKKLKEASDRCGRDKLERGNRLEEEGRTAEAIRFYRNILEEHPTCPAADTARERIGSLRAERAQATAADREEQAKQAGIEEVEEGLALATELRDKGDRLRRLGLLESGSLGKAEDDFLGAIQAYRRAEEFLKDLAERPGADDEKTDIGARRQALRSRLVEVYVDLGHNFVVKGNLIAANRYMGLALSIDPNDPKALALRQAIAIATGSDNWGRAR